MPSDLRVKLEALIEKWREEAERRDEWSHEQAELCERHANQLEAALAAQEDETEEPNARLLMGPTKTRGSVRGYIDAVNLHKQNKCYIFPAGDWPKVICTFRQEHKAVVLRNIQKFVTANGIAYYRPGEVTPHEMSIREIIEHEPLTDIPTLQDLHGIAPNITGDLDTLTFLDKLRGGGAAGAE